MNNVLELNDVHKSFGKIEIIKGISFEVKEGEVYGFLGPNGSGKTTTIRMIVGLIKPNSGNIRINGYDVQKQFVKAVSSVGCIVENPDMYLDFTGRENLNIFAKLYGNVDSKRIDEVVEIIGLKDRIDDKVKKYSLGMKQRLGLGQALLPKPKLLILDEPTNGLDPLGIIDFRNIVKNLAKECNTAVFVSSHILSEIEQLCDKVAFIDNGLIKSIEKINGLSSNSTEKIILKIHEIEKAKQLLGEVSFVKKVEEKEGSLIITADKDCYSMLITILSAKGIQILDINRIHQNLEDRFMEISGGGKHSEFV
ncbi:ABC transporter ATP-binding protein [Clostridium sp. YIM B02515]|uniref:ABC transporter ATP-binding protein n=1 Tax=Clostridium rhizosphaerae TaxID=2803861 RepID=A0ABS1TCI6_9CLOT|nr:ABC transporter ATP-binding protein [Clostridium rhizosphaerae]MBL4937083.1 ABC transporter ATP-binding protein [Clostridium rhizosphaerae]